MDYQSVSASTIAYIMTPAGVDEDCLSWIVLMQDDGAGRLVSIPCPMNVADAAAYFDMMYLAGDRIAVNVDTMTSLHDTTMDRGFANSLAVWDVGHAHGVLPLRTMFDAQQIMDVNMRGMAMRDMPSGGIAVARIMGRA